jgi:RNA recognition motif-containing protein
METELKELPLDTLEVSNLPSDVTKDVLELYFENPKSGGQDGAVKDVSFVSPGVAHVKFSDPESES